MKKFLLLFVCLFALFGLTSCDVAGTTWKFEEKTTPSLLGGTTTTKVGDTVLGKEITEDHMVVVFEKEGKGTMTFEGVAIEFTWVQEDKVIKATKSDATLFEAKIEKNRLIFEYLGSTFKLKK